MDKIEWMANLWPFSPVRNPDSAFKKKPPEAGAANMMGMVQEGLEVGGSGVEDAALSVTHAVTSAMEPPATVQQKGGSWLDGITDTVNNLTGSESGLSTVGGIMDSLFGNMGGLQPAMAGGGPGLGDMLGGLLGVQGSPSPGASSAEAAGATGEAGPGATAAGVQTEITVNATVETGDFKMNVDSLSGAEAAQFNRWLASKMGEIIKDELEKRNLG
jgi:hypothetical protein